MKKLNIDIVYNYIIQIFKILIGKNRFDRVVNV